MPIRYCGDLRINVSLTTKDDYIVSCQGLMVHVKPPAYLTKSLDCPESFDEAAHAGLSFMADEHMDTGFFQGARVTYEGWTIRRSK